MAEQDTNPISIPLEANAQLRSSQEHLAESETIGRRLSILEQDSNTNNQHSREMEIEVEDLIGLPDEADEKSKSLITYASFGDKGTTATVSPDGTIMQMTKFFGVGTSGFFSVNHYTVEEPYLVQFRALDLVGNCEYDDGISWSPYNSLGPGPFVEIIDSEAPWKLEFVQNRWPQLTSCEIVGFQIISQNFVSDGTVFQEIIHKANEESVSVISEEANWTIDLSNYRIRQLDFTREDFAAGYESHLTCNGRSLILVRGSVMDRDEMGDVEDVEEDHPTVCLITSISINGEVQELEKVDSTPGHVYQIKLKRPNGFSAIRSKPVAVTQAFRLQLISMKSKWKDIGIPAFRCIGDMLQPTFEKLVFDDKDKHLDFIILRNLEHILSVCSIPVNTRTDRPYEDDAIALTCGDISGHRLVTAASFFAFKFLLDMYDYLDKRAKECNHDTIEVNICRKCQYTKELRDRIKKTCEAHVKWVEDAELVVGPFQFSERRSFGANYWATGKLIKLENEDIWQPLAPVYFQLLKLAEFAMKWDGDSIRNSLEKHVTLWIEELDSRNERGFFAFATRFDWGRGDSKYRLEDHVWIWRLLTCVDKLGLANIITKKGRHSKRSGKDLLQNYSPEGFRRQVLRRFTTENTVSGHRMFAVRRSASQNRFGLRARDIALFYGGESAFFTESEPLWKATIDAQKFHVENQDDCWNDPLRYTLAYLMAYVKKLRINSRSLTEMSNTARDVLYQSSSGNGLLPGMLNTDTKEPEIFQSENLRDYYWHVSFEVPYALWTISQAIPSEAPQLGSDLTGARNPTQPTGVPEPFYEWSKNMEMKRSIPFNSLIDRGSIVEFSDEWLYRRPQFLYWTPGMHPTGSIIRKNMWCKDANANSFTSTDREDDILRGIVVDVPKTKSDMSYKKQNDTGKDVDYPALSNLELYKQLNRERTPNNAKKRLIWSCNANDETRLLCYLVSRKDDQERLSSFFIKHQRKEKYFFDDATATKNLWVTEFHLSSWQIFSKTEYDTKEPKKTDLNFLGGGNRIRRACMGFHFVGDFFDRYWNCHVFEYEPRNDRRPEAWSQEEMKESFKKLIDLEITGLVTGKQPWHQRKVLELLLFHRMLQKITRRYTELLTEINRSLESLQNAKSRRDLKRSRRVSADTPRKELPSDMSNDLPSKASEDPSLDGDTPLDILSASNELFSSPLNYDTYSVFRDQWPAIQYSLQVIEEDLTDTFEKIDLWNAREKDRKLEQPRWTRNDESRYRSSITKVSTANGHKIRDLQRYLSSIQSLRESLKSRLESTRDDLAFQSAENVRFFTYVTVVFLPMGFGTAIFSMNVTPAGRLVAEMAGTALATLLITAFALAYAQDIDQMIITPLRDKLHRRRKSPSAARTTSLPKTPSSTENPSHFRKIIWPWRRNGAAGGANNNNPSSLEKGKARQ
ncbi:hypothetical protein BGZ57DRAFT_959328 [Hyaloscypha finlandica]|nr:hypothetical protein BGZ57DRAFT_959328 [Hyaloscypha finlandica]